MGLGKALMLIPGVRQLLRAMQRFERNGLETNLRRYGLRYDDLLNEYDPEVKKAIEQLPAWEQELRIKRIKRAFDIDIKKTYLAPEIAAKEDIWNPYIRSRVSVLKRERFEKQITEY
ncbi:Cytochrome b-c1 complex subunit 7-2 [Porphyridium purpureum]|uniref:Cytochrome b-c1 complex subunit 7-2 n=1 Tax=Porphyridium purpureum TaxID=35688 RepID=A0A5J4YYP2_PORPP|nr:Cytochrome b-c1 complex subunit 7-2 [Porphyridium purpureum]|eukprot:POR0022..scf209_3